MKKLTTIVPFWVWLLVAIVLMSFIVVDVRKHRTPEEKICDGTSYLDQSKQCCRACNELGHEFLKGVYFTDGWGRDGVNKCFCKDGNKSIQIY